MGVLFVIFNIIFAFLPIISSIGLIFAILYISRFTNFVRRLVTKGKRSHTIVTRVTLKKANSSTGIQFSQAVFSVKRSLADEEINAVLPLVEHIKELSKKIALDQEPEISASFDVDEETGEVIPLR